MDTYAPDWIPQPSVEYATEVAERIGFGSVITHGDDGLAVSHVPVHVERDDAGRAQELRFHLAAGNRLAECLRAGSQVLVMFRGPDGYVSPAWYDHENVPTWDYAFVHMSGTARTLTTPQLRDHLLELIEQFEPGLTIRDAFIDRYLPEIIGFGISKPDVQPVFKLSQDKNPTSLAGVLAGLRARNRGQDADLAAHIEHLTATTTRREP